MLDGDKVEMNILDTAGQENYAGRISNTYEIENVRVFQLYVIRIYVVAKDFFLYLMSLIRNRLLI